MSAPDPQDFSLLAKVVAAGTMVAAPIVWLWAKLDGKADKQAVKESFEKIDAELTIHRGYFKDVFNQIRESDQRAQDRHERIMERLSK